MGNSDWVRRVDRPSWLEAGAQWPRAGHRRGMPVRGYPLGQPLPIALIGEGPGKDESHYGYPFVGASGQEVDRHLKRVGLSRDMCLVTNYTWQVPAAKGELGAVNPKLVDELTAAGPAVIATLGAHSTRAFLGQDATMEAVHGIPHLITPNWVGGYPVTVLPMYHPAAGMHQVELSAHVAYDFDALAATMAGELAPRVGSADEWPDPVYVEETDAISCPKPPLQCDGGIAIDTEGSVARPWGLSWSDQPGRATVTRASERNTLDGFGRVLRFAAQSVPGFRVWLHNSMHDLPVLQALGIDLVEWGIPFLDTMVLAYHLCVEPQGLKALAFRHCGMRMDSYLDLVNPYTHERAVTYLAAVGCDTGLPKRDGYVDFEVKGRVMTPKYHQPTPIYKRAAKILSDVASGKVNKDGELTDPYKRWYQVEPEDRAVAERVYGVLEMATLDEVPLPIAVRYACLAGESLVETRTGMLKIKDLVRDHATVEVRSLAIDGSFVWRPITGWYRNLADAPIDWHTVETEHSRGARWGTAATRYTPDHRLWSRRGWVEVQHLTADDEIALPVAALSAVARQIAIGSVLGDGSIAHRNSGGWPSLRFSHCERQLDYLIWKTQLLGEVEARPGSATLGRQAFAGATGHYATLTMAHPEFLPFRTPIAKRLGNWVDELDVLGLAVWYQDDGCLVGGRTPRLYTNGFTADETDRLRRLLRDRWGVESSRTESSGRVDQGFISIPSIGARAFFAAVAPLVHPSMAYKLPGEWQGLFEPSAYLPSFQSPGPFWAKVQRVTRRPPSAGRRGAIRTSYCLDVAETHNFCTAYEIAHNCRDADATRRLGPGLLARHQAVFGRAA